MFYKLFLFFELTTAECAKTMGKAKALSTIPAVRKRANSDFGFVSLFGVVRLDMKTGNTDKT